ncbi:hypothetical protein OG883_42950 [Streptomyces sp. NBC_01142]|uniref:hypothetical protein n=1 Tax=Streptomyces sp. NBC_01142 TaxID=2975865 RepID=UPI00224E016A|nr:hypothetical protein [Streptomyces sp. NBC_01142]MCX4826403.1 hypothetical protein [Streptomyces sp. NBC_01142]
MFCIIRTSVNRQLNQSITELHDRAVTAENRIAQALELLEGQDTAQANQMRALLKGHQL